VLVIKVRLRPVARLAFPENAGVAIRGALGYVLPEGVFRPRRTVGPSGLRDTPRAFVLRVRHLDGRTIEAGENFEIGLNLFAPGLEGVFREALQRRGATGVGRGQVKLEWLGWDAREVRCELAAGEGVGLGRADLGLLVHPLPDGRGSQAGDDTPAQPLPLVAAPLHGRGPEVQRGSEGQSICVKFLTPTELKGWDGEGLPPFEVVAARARDRVSALQAVYGGGEPALDFRGLGERAREVHTVEGSIDWVRGKRKSARTGQTHPLAGFRGIVRYVGVLGEFVPLLRAACYTGIGRQTVWGHGEIALE